MKRACNGQQMDDYHARQIIKSLGYDPGDQYMVYDAEYDSWTIFTNQQMDDYHAKRMIKSLGYDPWSVLTEERLDRDRE